MFGLQAANLAGFRASEDPRFEAGIPDFMNGILNFSIHFNVVHRKVDWRNPKMKSLNSMPGLFCRAYECCIDVMCFYYSTVLIMKRSNICQYQDFKGR